MRDCENVDVRERLPELLHERLRGAERERVLAHLSECADCSAELALMRSVRAVSTADAPRVNVAAIAGAVGRELAATSSAERPTDALPFARPAARPAMRPRARRWAAAPIRAAAAVVLMAFGAGGVLLARRGEAPRPIVADTLAVATPADAPSGRAPGSATGSAATPRADVVPTSAPASALGATFADLTDDELAAVLQAIDETDGTLPAEPSPSPTVVGTGGDL